MTTVLMRAAALLSAAHLIAGCPAQSPPADIQQTAVALTGARLIDGTGGPPIEPATLVIDKGRVVAVGAVEAVRVPDGAEQVNLSGRTIIPGFVNAHAHLNNGDPALSAREQLLTQLRLYASYGVTTVQSLGDNGVASIALRNEQAEGAVDGARLFVSGVGVTPGSVEEARQVADRYAELGVDIIKTRLEGNARDMPPEVYRALIERAHERGLRVAAHIFYLSDAKGMMDAGVDVIAHSVRDQDVDTLFIDELKRRDVGYIATLTRDLSVYVYESTPSFFGDPFFLRGIESFPPNRRQMDQLLEPARQERTRNNRQTQSIKTAIEQAKRNLKLLSDGGVTIAFGTDSGTALGRWQGFFEHTELELMVEAGMTPMQTLVAATGDAAKAMHLDEVGTLEPGKWADLIVLGSDPLADIRNTRTIESVWIGGVRR